MLLTLKILLSESKIALIFLNSSESTSKILNSLIKLSESDKAIEKVIINYKINNFRELLSTKFQFSNTEYYNERINEWNNVDKEEINLWTDFGFFLTRGLRILFDIDFDSDLDIHLARKFFGSLRPSWNELFRNIDREIRDAERFAESKNNSGLELKLRLHRVFRFKFNNRSLNKENLSILEEVCSAKTFEKQINKLLELEKSVSNFLTNLNTNTETINRLFNDYKSRRNEYLSNINNTLNILLDNSIPRISSEIEKNIQSEEINSDLEFSKLVIDNLKKSHQIRISGSRVP